jgi:hypothetical protein
MWSGSARFKAFYLPDRKRVLIDSSQPKLKWRWNEAHEIIRPKPIMVPPNAMATP